MDFGGRQTAGEVLDRIRRESLDESEKGRWFEQLFMRLALQEAEFEIDAVWRWPDWPERAEQAQLLTISIWFHRNCPARVRAPYALRPQHRAQPVRHRQHRGADQ